MDVTTYIQRQMANVRSQVDAALKELTDEQFNWPPPGTINPISATLIHLLAGEDFFVQVIIRGKHLLWEEQEWGHKIGIQAPPKPSRSWEEFKTIKISVEPVLAYQQAIRAATDACLAELTADELDRQVYFVGKLLPVAEVLMILMVHMASHAGEIAAVRGMQGIKGLPF